MKKHSNLSIFVPHQGCPCRCSFCNQNEISGTQNPPTGKDVTELCEEFLPQKGEGENTEIAFFGGS
ncbi:MAG: radical SAM protein, partial [Oscillospiraceae bacterium]